LPFTLWRPCADARALWQRTPFLFGRLAARRRDLALPAPTTGLNALRLALTDPLTGSETTATSTSASRELASDGTTAWFALLPSTSTTQRSTTSSAIRRRPRPSQVGSRLRQAAIVPARWARVRRGAVGWTSRIALGTRSIVQRIAETEFGKTGAITVPRRATFLASGRERELSDRRARPERSTGPGTRQNQVGRPAPTSAELSEFARESVSTDARFNAARRSPRVDSARAYEGSHRPRCDFAAEIATKLGFQEESSSRAPRAPP